MADHQQRRGADAVIREMVLGKPRGIEAPILGVLNECHRIGEDIANRRAACTKPHQVKQAELYHRGTSCPFAKTAADTDARALEQNA